MGWMYPVKREGTSTPAVRAGRVIYWIMSGIGGLVTLTGLVGSLMEIGTQSDWWVPYVMSMCFGIVLHLLGRGARYILADE